MHVVTSQVIVDPAKAAAMTRLNTEALRTITDCVNIVFEMADGSRLQCATNSVVRDAAAQVSAA